MTTDALEKGFEIHHGTKKYIQLTLWLPENEISPIPPFAQSYLGVACIVINQKKEAIAMIEKFGTNNSWKFPVNINHHFKKKKHQKKNFLFCFCFFLYFISSHNSNDTISLNKHKHNNKI